MGVTLHEVRRQKESFAHWPKPFLARRQVQKFRAEIFVISFPFKNIFYPMRHTWNRFDDKVLCQISITLTHKFINLESSHFSHGLPEKRGESRQSHQKSHPFFLKERHAEAEQRHVC